jgi:Domain of unknown function (DUF5666)
MKKNILIPILIASAIVLIAGAGVGGFFSGKAYERNQANQTRNNFLRERGIQGFNPNAAPGSGQTSGNFPAGGFGRGATGQIKSIDGNTITLTEGQTEVKVTLSDTTKIEKSTAGSTADLATGQQVMVTGQRDTSGNLTATQVLILATSAPQTSSGTTP